MNDSALIYHKKIGDKKNGYIYLDKNGNELYHIYANGDMTYKMRDGSDIIIYNDGRYKFDGKEYKCYSCDMDQFGNIYFSNLDGSINAYNRFGLMEYKDSSGNNSKSINYYNGTITAVVNGKPSFSKINRIEYDEEAYNDLMSGLINIKDEYEFVLKSKCQLISQSANNLYEPYQSGELNSLENRCTNYINSIEELKTNINYSLLAYQACDSGLFDKMKIVIDSLFEADDPLGNEFRNYVINNDIEDRNNDRILEYKVGTDFYKVNTKFDNLLDFNDYVNTFIETFNPSTYGLDNKTVRKEIFEIVDERGIEEVRNVLEVFYHVPANYAYYDPKLNPYGYGFKPSNITRNNDYYNFDYTTINKYQTNSEKIYIQGTEFEFVQVLPAKCKSFELLAYNVTKANVINTMYATPKPIIDMAAKKSNVIVLTCDSNSQQVKNKPGYYIEDSLSKSSGIIVIDAHNGFSNPNFCTEDFTLHLLMHKYDDMLEENILLSGFKGRHTDLNISWYNTVRHHENGVRRKFSSYQGVACLEHNHEYDKQETFAIAMVDYLKYGYSDCFSYNGAYDDINRIIDPSYKGSFNTKLKNVVNSAIDIHSNK